MFYFPSARGTSKCSQTAELVSAIGKKAVSVGSKGVQRALRLAHVGVQFGMTVIALTVGGYYLDRHYQSAPAFTLVGLLLGFVAGLYHLVIETQKARRALQLESDAKKAERTRVRSEGK